MLTFYITLFPLIHNVWDINNTYRFLTTAVYIVANASVALTFIKLHVSYCNVFSELFITDPFKPGGLETSANALCVPPENKTNVRTESH